MDSLTRFCCSFFISLDGYEVFNRGKIRLPLIDDESTGEMVIRPRITTVIDDESTAWGNCYTVGNHQLMDEESTKRMRLRRKLPAHRRGILIGMGFRRELLARRGG
jgi:hypothetical protein